MSILFDFDMPSFIVRRESKDQLYSVFLRKGNGSKGDIIGTILDESGYGEILFKEHFLKEHKALYHLTVTREREDGSICVKFKNDIIDNSDLEAYKEKGHDLFFYDCNRSSVSLINNLYMKKEHFLVDVNKHSSAYKLFIKNCKDNLVNGIDSQIININDVVYSAFSYKLKWSYVNLEHQKVRQGIFVHLFFDGVHYMQVKQEIYDLVKKYNEGSQKDKENMQESYLKDLLEQNIVEICDNNLELNVNHFDNYTLQESVFILASNAIVKSRDALKFYYIKSLSNL